MGFPSIVVVNVLPANAGDARAMGSIPELGRSPGEGNGNLLQYSCLENSMDRVICWATMHEVAKSRTQLCTHAKHIQYGCQKKNKCVWWEEVEGEVGCVSHKCKQKCFLIYQKVLFTCKKMQLCTKLNEFFDKCMQP